MKRELSTLRFVANLLTLVRPYRKQFWLGLLALFLGSAMNLALPQLAKLLIDNHFRELVVLHPVSSALLLATLFAIQNLFFYFRSYFFSSVGIKVTSDVRTKLFSTLLDNELSYHDQNDWADTRSRLLNDVQLIQDGVSLRLSVFLRYAIQVLVGAILMAWISPLLALIALCAIPPLLILGAGFGRRLKILSRKTQESISELSRDIDDGLGQIRLVKALGAEKSMQQRFKSHNQATVQATVARARFAGFFSSFLNFLLNAALLFVVIYGLYLVSSGTMTSGDLTAFLLYGTIVAVSFAFVISSYTELVQASVAGERIFSITEASKQEAIKSSLEIDSGRSGGDEIIFKSVNFKYPSRPDSEILSNLSLHFAANSSTAIVGSSGGGKSTIASLILKLYTPVAGEILFNKISLDSINTSLIRNRVAIVPQDAPLISASIRDNLLLGVENKTEADLLAVLEQANLSDFLKSLPNGIDTQLGERGVQLSGGQRQRLAIARALLRNASTLILDEATAALDTENEQHLLEVVAKLKSKTTLIVISHRLSTLRIADRVVVLKRGQVVQEGSYNEVVSSPGLFKSMIETAEVEDQ